jgi:transglutaminase-like putative cysteine protease
VNYEIVHRTVYEYSSEVSVSQHIAHLTPREMPHQHCLRHDLLVDPAPAFIARRHDYFENPTWFFTMAGAHRALAVTSRSEIAVEARTGPEPTTTSPWEQTCSPTATADLPIEIQEYVFPSALVPQLPELADYAKPSFPTDRPLLEAALELTNRIHTDFTFDPKATTVATPLEKVIAHRRGVCQDFAHIQIGCMRALGLPARYVSGYLETLPPEGKQKLIGSDASHAWVQIFLPNVGWLDIDPTNNMQASERHIVVAWGRDFDDVSPIRGVISGGGQHKLTVAVDVLPLRTHRNPSKPPFKTS